MKRALLVLVLLCATSAAQVTGISPGMWKSGAAPAWTPASLDSLFVWAQADSITGKNHGDTVGIWRNNWAAGNLFNISGTDKPTYYTNIINGKPVLFFDATDDILQSKNNALGYKTGISSFAVIKYRATGANVVGVSASSVGYGGGDNWYANTRQLSGAFNGVVNDGGGSQTVTGPADDTLAHVHTLLFAGSDSVVFWIDGTRYGAATTKTRIDLRAEIDLGAIDNNGTTILPANAYIAEVVIYGGRKSNADAKLVRDYLKAKWGTP